MGKYMRKRTGRAPAAELPQVVVGVRTRSRSAAFASAAPAPKRLRKQAAAARAEAAEVAGGGDGGCAAAAGCYLQLRSRRLFMAAAAAADVRCPVAAEEKAALLAGEEERSAGASSLEPVVEVVAGISRCSSTASSVDVVVTKARERIAGAAEGSGTRRGPRRRELRQRLGHVRAREEGGDAVEPAAGRSQRRGIESGSGQPKTPPSSDVFARCDGRAGSQGEDAGRGRDGGVLRGRGEGRGRALRSQVQLRRRPRPPARRRRRPVRVDHGGRQRLNGDVNCTRRPAGKSVKRVRQPKSVSSGGGAESEGPPLRRAVGRTKEIGRRKLQRGNSTEDTAAEQKNTSKKTRAFLLWQ